MARDSKEWRRPSLSLSSHLLHPPSASSTSSSSRRSNPALVRLRSRYTLAAATFTSLLLVLYFSLSSSPASTTFDRSHPATWTARVGADDHPNFDFDAHGTGHAEHQVDEEESHEGSVEEEELHVELPAMDDELDDAEDDNGLRDARPASQVVETSTAARPFLPFSCDACSPFSTSTPSLSTPTCAKYRSAPGDSRLSLSPLHPDILDHSLLFPGTGSEVRRVLKRAMKSSLIGAKRAREVAEQDAQKWEDEEPFRVLVLGGSVSNCRGVDANTACWHAHVLRWFQQTFPMEGDRDLVPDVPSLLLPPLSNDGRSHPGDSVRREKHSLPKAPPSSANSSSNDFSSSPSVSPSSAPRLTKRSTVKKKKKKAKSKKLKSGSSSRRRPSTKLINGSKSATGSAFFAYCFDEEMTLRRKNVDWGKGPDLIIIESGVNDVWPGGEQATRDFERLLRRLRSLPSDPAIISLEAASLLLASTSSTTANAEYDHLPAAHYYDVPILSAKHALFGPVPGLLPPDATVNPLKIEDLFLPDLHHPNERGHEFLADVLISYLERQACVAQSEILATANERIISRSSLSTVIAVEPAHDIPRRKEEPVRPLPPRSLFSPFPHGKAAKKNGGGDGVWELTQTRCIQVGNSKTTVEPVRNEGWTKLAWARDKQYLTADKPGASVTFRIEVGNGGTILADWLHSRFYDLGDVTVYLDSDPSASVSLAGYWDLGWSIGVPTEIFSGVEPGVHEVTFEILPGAKSSHPKGKTNFRLIGLIAT
ncbi:hypothetical protein JCM11251_005487 [Rhodosporidiobolus azoricus]